MGLDAVILCGGKGKRLCSLVPDRQKCVSKINGTPFLCNLIRYIALFNINRFILCVGYKYETVIDAVSILNKKYEIVYSQESNPLGTGGAIINAAQNISSSNFMVFNGDSICHADFSEMILFHKKKKSMLTMLLSKCETNDDYGSVEIDSNFRLQAFHEKTGGNAPYINAGAYIFSKKLLLTHMKDKPFSLELDLFPSILEKDCYGYVTDEPLFDIGTPSKIQIVSSYLQSHKRI